MSPLDNPHPHKFDPYWKDHLNSPELRKLDPEQVLDFLPLRLTDRVADIGAGTGFFSLPLAHRLPQGKVLALDISPEMLASLQEKVARAGAANLEAALCGESDFPAEPGGFDGVLLFFVLHEAADRPAFLKAAKSLLKQGGWAAILDWQARTTASSPPGPPIEVRIPQDDARHLAIKSGFTVVAERAIGADYYILLLET